MGPHEFGEYIIRGQLCTGRICTAEGGVFETVPKKSHSQVLMRRQPVLQASLVRDLPETSVEGDAMTFSS